MFKIIRIFIKLKTLNTFYLLNNFSNGFVTNINVSLLSANKHLFKNYLNRYQIIVFSKVQNKQTNKC